MGIMYYDTGDSMDEILEHTLLYDFYGELLTKHQQKIYEDVVFNDLSYSEVAKDQGVSRQSIYDLIKRINRILDDYESKLHLVEHYMKARKLGFMIHELTQEYKNSRNEALILKISDLSAQLMELQK